MFCLFQCYLSKVKPITLLKINNNLLIRFIEEKNKMKIYCSYTITDQYFEHSHFPSPSTPTSSQVQWPLMEVQVSVNKWSQKIVNYFAVVLEPPKKFLSKSEQLLKSYLLIKNCPVKTHILELTLFCQILCWIKVKVIRDNKLGAEWSLLFYHSVRSLRRVRRII